MSHTAPQGDGRISRLHARALSEEIGDRLRLAADSECAVTPLHLQQLMTRFQSAEYPGD